MEGSVKERLTGALIFVATLVILVPEMLSGPRPKVAGAAVASAQPADAGPPLLTYSMDLKASADAQAPVQAAPASLAPAPAVVPATSTDAASVAVAGAPVAAAPAAAAAEPSPAAPEQPGAVASTASQKGMWWVQLDSFSVRENAERLARQLRAAGFAVDVSRINARGKDLYRVRAGPVRDRAEALVLQSRLMANGNKSMLIAP